MFDDNFMCPYCFYIDKLIAFRMKMRGGGFSKKRYVCPECRQIMLKRTLFMDLSLGELAQWIYANIRVFQRDNFYENRLSMDMIVERVRVRGWGNEFWEAWKEAKTFDMDTLNDIIEKTYNVENPQTKLVT